MQKLPKLSDPVKQECNSSATSEAYVSCVIGVEAMSSVIEEIASLSIRNYHETGIDPSIEYNPDWAMYLSYELTDSVRIITARYNGVLVGYAAFLIGPFKHNKDVLYADLDAIWISPGFRSGFLAMKMIKRGEKELLGKVQFIMATSTVKKPIDKLLERAGYNAVEVLYYKPLGVTNGIEQSAIGSEESSGDAGSKTGMGISEREYSSGSGEHSSEGSI